MNATNTRPEHDPRLIARRLKRGGRERFRVACWMIQAEYYLRDPEDFEQFVGQLWRWMQPVRHAKRKLNKALVKVTGLTTDDFLPRESGVSR